MPHAKCLKIIGFSILPALITTMATASDEIVASTDLAELVSSQQRLQSQMEEHLRVRIETLFEDELDQVLTDRTTALLRAGNRNGARPHDAPPAAMQELDGSRPTGNTTCTMVGSTLECVLRD
jgi:hypothetical protein